MGEVAKLEKRIAVLNQQIKDKEVNIPALSKKMAKAANEDNEESVKSIKKLRSEMKEEVQLYQLQVEQLENQLPFAMQVDAQPALKKLQAEYDALSEKAGEANELLSSALKQAEKVFLNAIQPAMDAERVILRSARLSHDTGVKEIKTHIIPFPDKDTLEIVGRINSVLSRAALNLGVTQNTISTSIRRLKGHDY